MFRLTLIFSFLVLFLQGCATNSDNEVKISTAGTAGIFYALGNGIANVWEDEVEGVTSSACPDFIVFKLRKPGGDVR